jgi:uncharacterized protein
MRLSLGEIGEAIGNAVLRRPRTVVAIGVAACLLLAAGGLRLWFSTDYTIFFSDDDPRAVALANMEETYGGTDSVVFVVKPRRGDVFQPRALAALQALAEAGRDLPYARRVDSLTGFPLARADGEDLVIEPLVPRPAGELDPGELARIRARAMSDPLIIGSLLGPGGGAAGVQVTVDVPRASPAAVTDVAAAARALLDKVQSDFPELTIRASGLALMNDALMEASLDDIAWIVPLMFLAMVVVMAVLLRSVWVTSIVVGMIALSTGAAMGVAGWLGYPLTPPSASAPTLVITLCVADSVHLLGAVRRLMAGGLSQALAIPKAMQQTTKPIVLTSVTTAIGFLCLNTADSPPFVHMANMVAVGVTVDLLLSLTVMPAMLSLRPLRAAAPRAAGTSPVWGRFALQMVRWRRPILAAAITLTAAGAWLASRIETNDQFVEYFDESIAFRGDTEFMMENLAGLYVVDFDVPAGGEGGVVAPGYLATLDRFATWLRAQPEVTHVAAVSDIVRRLHRSMNGDDPAADRIPDSRELAAQYLLSYEMSLPEGQSLADRVALDRSASRVSVVVGDLSSREMRAFTRRSEDWLRRNAPSSMQAEGLSPVVLFSHLSDRNTDSMTRGNFLSLGLISLCLTLVVKRRRLGLLSMVPNLVPIAIAYGAWSLLFGEMNIVVAFGASICMGIVVDDTLHFMTLYDHARSDLGLPAAPAIRHTFDHVAAPLVDTTAILLVGFGMLTLSHFQMNSTFGGLVVLVLALGIVCELVFLPACLVALDRAPAPSHFLAPLPEAPLAQHGGDR